MDPNNDRPGKIDDLLRVLKPKNVTVPAQTAEKSDSMPDFQPGGIDAVLATLKPKARKRSARPDAQNPCERCGFDLADMGPSYANENILCPSCRETTNIGLPNSAPLAKNCILCGFELEQMYVGYNATNTMCPPCREKSPSTFASSVARKQREQLSQFVEQGQSATTTESLRPQAEEPRDDGFTCQQLASQRPVADRVTTLDTLSNIPTDSTTAGLRRKIEKVDIVDNSLVDISSMTPSARAHFRKHNEAMRNEVDKRIKEQVAELEEVKRMLADAESKVAARKAAVGKAAKE